MRKVDSIFVRTRHQWNRHTLGFLKMYFIIKIDVGVTDKFAIMGAFFLLRQSGLTDLARRVCRSFIRPSVSFLVF